MAYLTSNMKVDNSKYIEKREVINPEEFGVMYVERVKKEIPNLESAIQELIGASRANIYTTNTLKTKLNLQQIQGLTIEFFYTINPEYAKEVKDIIDNKKTNIVEIENPEYDGTKVASCQKFYREGVDFGIPLEFIENLRETNPEFYQEMIKFSQQQIIRTIIIPLKKNMEDLYAYVHEFTHYFEESNEYSSTERILDEIAPQCMERLLDDFLLSLPNEKLKQYNLNREDLREDVDKMRMLSFYSRYDAAVQFNDKVSQDSKNKLSGEEFLKYMLAQIYQTQFLKYNSEDRKTRILQFMEHVKNDKFQEANNTFGVNWHNQLKRSNYIDMTVNNAKLLIEGKCGDKPVTNQKTKQHATEKTH